MTLTLNTSFRITRITPYSSENQDWAKDNYLGIKKFDHLVLNGLRDYLQFRYKANDLLEGSYGVELANGSFTGMMGVLQRNETDILIGIGCSNPRMKVSKCVPYPWELSYNYVIPALKKSEVYYASETFTSSFRTETWILILASAVAVLVRKKLFGFCYKKQSGKFRPKHSIIPPLFRLMALTYTFSVLFLMLFYGVMLTSKTSLVEKGRVIKTLKDFGLAVKNGDYKIGFLNGSLQGKVVEKTMELPRPLQKYVTPVKTVNIDVVKVNKSAMVIISKVLETTAVELNYSLSEFNSIEERIRPILYGLTFRKDFAFFSQFKLAVDRFHASGLFIKWDTELLRKYHNALNASKLVVKNGFITIFHLKVIFQILHFCYAFYILVLITEILFKKFHP